MCIVNCSGKELKKWKSFIDFKDCAEFLISKGTLYELAYPASVLSSLPKYHECISFTSLSWLGYTSPELLCASGNSAGGLIMGVMINQYCHLFRAVVMRYRSN